MANTRSAIKRMRQNPKRRLRNRFFRGRARTSVKNARLAIESGDPEAAQEAIRAAASDLDKAAQKGVLHKKNAARRKSRLMKRLAAQEKEQTK
ncbi:MAG: 30S ribosomal protein S20 [Chloroflexota bacterium]